MVDRDRRHARQDDDDLDAGALLETAGLDPTVINGGIIKRLWHQYQARRRRLDGGRGRRERRHLHAPPGDDRDRHQHRPRASRFLRRLAALQQAFEVFVGNIPFYGFAVLCIDHPVVQGMIARLSERRILTYGLSPQADIRATNIRLGPDGSHYDAVIADRVTGGERVLAGLFLPMFGEHNVQNR